MNQLARLLNDKFPGGDYFRTFREGPCMELEELNNSPIFRRFRVLFSKDKKEVKRVLCVPSISVISEARDSINEVGLFAELKSLLQEDALTATIFIKV